MSCVTPAQEQLKDSLVFAARAQFALELERELIPAIITASALDEAEYSPEILVQANATAAQAAAEVRRILRTHAVKSACIAAEAAERLRKGKTN